MRHSSQHKGTPAPTVLSITLYADDMDSALPTAFLRRGEVHTVDILATQALPTYALNTFDPIPNRPTLMLTRARTGQTAWRMMQIAVARLSSDEEDSRYL